MAKKHNFSKRIKNEYYLARCLKKFNVFFFRNPSRTQIVNFSLGQKGRHYLGMSHTVCVIIWVIVIILVTEESRIEVIDSFYL